MKKIIVLVVLISNLIYAEKSINIQNYFNFNIQNLLQMKNYLEIDKIIDTFAYENQDEYMIYKFIEGQISTSLNDISLYVIKEEDRFELLLKVEQPERAPIRIKAYLPKAFIPIENHYGLNDEYKQQLVDEQDYYENLYLIYKGNSYYLSTSIDILENVEYIISELDDNSLLNDLQERKLSLIKVYSDSKMITELPINEEMETEILKYKDMIMAIDKYFNRSILYIDFDSNTGNIILKGESLDNTDDISSEVYMKFPGEFLKVYGNIFAETILSEMDI